MVIEMLRWPFFLVLSCLLFCSAEAGTIPLPKRLGEFALNERLPRDIFGKASNDCRKGSETYNAGEEIAREMWLAILPTFDSKRTSAEIYTVDRAVASITFWVRGVRYPEVVRGLKSMYGSPRLKETAETSDFPHWKEWKWEDENAVLILSVEPENLEWNLDDQVLFVNIHSTKKNALIRCTKPHAAKP